MDISTLENMLNSLQIPHKNENLSLLLEYMDYILSMNKEINLTAITNENEFINKMILDSALPLRLFDFSNKKILDIGTGAGYPGTVISLLTDADVLMLDSTAKKVNVINNFKGYKFKAISGRAENLILDNRESYDIVTARAVSMLPILLELSLPFVKIGGYFIALKGREYLKEINESLNALKKLGGEIVKIDCVTLPNGDERYNILIKKVKTTNKKYPRDYSQIKKAHL